MWRLGILFLSACGAAGAPPGDTTAPDAAAPIDAAPELPTFPDSLGAHYDSDGGAVRFRVKSAAATRIELYLYAAPYGEEERATFVMAKDGDVFSVTVPADGLPIYYGYRAWGINWPYDPSWTKGSLAGFVADVDADGNRFDPNKLLFDPYARELSHDPHNPDSRAPADYGKRGVDTGRFAPKGIILRDVPLDHGSKPARALRHEVIYEVHPRGLTRSDPEVPEALRGTFAGAARKAAYLRDLGVTAIELLPVHETQNDMNDAAQSTSGMNYWGYSSLSFFAPDRRYAADKTPGGPTRELASMVKAFHDAGIKVYLDVVYNHTGEGGRQLSFRGLDNATYYELTSDNQKNFDSTGTSGNVNCANETVRALIMDSLRYYAETVGVDGFRFDLASVLGNACTRGCFRYDKSDPKNVLNRGPAELPGVDFIAEPWAIGPGTYQIGNFPPGWAEWNGQFRDTVRKVQNKAGVEPITPAELLRRLSGSPDLFADDGRDASASINYVASHDGFTLRDVHAYDTKKNDQPWPYGPSSGGDDANHSWDQGGDIAQQRRQTRNAMTLVMMAAGVPMFTGGDEMFRTQYGNNNPYNLDSDKNWLDWAAADVEMRAFTRGVIAFRREHPDLLAWKEVTVYRATGERLNDMNDAATRYLGIRVGSVFIAYNYSGGEMAVKLPPGKWMRAIDTFAAFAGKGAETSAFPLPPRSIVVLSL